MDDKDWLVYMKDHYLPFCRHYGFYRDLQKKIIYLLRRFIPRPKYVADLGCGPGLTLDLLLKYFPSIERIDCYEKIKGLAAVGMSALKYFKKEKSKVEFFENFDIARPFNIFPKRDLILSINVLYIDGLQDKKQLIDNIKENLSGNGIAVIATVMAAWNDYKSNGSLVRDEILYNLLLKPWRIPFSLFPLLRHSMAVNHYNRALSSKLTADYVRELIENNGLTILETQPYYTPRKYLWSGAEKAGGLIYIVKKKSK